MPFSTGDGGGGDGGHGGGGGCAGWWMDMTVLDGDSDDGDGDYVDTFEGGDDGDESDWF